MQNAGRFSLTMARPRRPGPGEHLPADLFSIDPTSYLPMALADRPWPNPARFPVNHAGSHVQPVTYPCSSPERPLRHKRGPSRFPGKGL